MKLHTTTSALAAAFALTAGTVASAGSHSLFITETNGITDFSGIDLGVTISHVGNQFVFDVVNNSTDGTVVTGFYFEMDEVDGRDHDMRQYVNFNTVSVSEGVDSDATFGSFTTLAGWEGSDLSDFSLSGDSASSVIPVAYVDNKMSREDYRIAFSLSNSFGTAYAVTGEDSHLFIAQPEPIQVQRVAFDQSVAPVAAPSPTAAAAGLGLLGALGLRRRRNG